MNARKCFFVTLFISLALLFSTLIALAEVPSGYTVSWYEVSHNGKSYSGQANVTGNWNMQPLSSVVFTASVPIGDHYPQCVQTNAVGTEFTCSSELQDNGLYAVGALINISGPNQKLCVIFNMEDETSYRSCQVFNKQAVETSVPTDIVYDIISNQDGSKEIFLRYESFTMDPPAYVKFVSSDPMKPIDWGSPCNPVDYGYICELTKNPVNGLTLGGVIIDMVNPKVEFCVRLTWQDSRLLERCYSETNSSVVTPDPTEEATVEPTATITATVVPTEEATPVPSQEPTEQPTAEVTPTPEVTVTPSPQVTPAPEMTPEPPIVEPTQEPTTELPVETPAVIVDIPPAQTPEPPVEVTPQPPTALNEGQQPSPQFQLRLPALHRP